VVNDFGGETLVRLAVVLGRSGQFHITGEILDEFFGLQNKAFEHLGTGHTSMTEAFRLFILFNRDEERVADV
jgi:hypothetical protein